MGTAWSLQPDPESFYTCVPSKAAMDIEVAQHMHRATAAEICIAMLSDKPVLLFSLTSSASTVRGVAFVASLTLAQQKLPGVLLSQDVLMFCRVNNQTAPWSAGRTWHIYGSRLIECFVALRATVFWPESALWDALPCVDCEALRPIAQDYVLQYGENVPTVLWRLCIEM